MLRSLFVGLDTSASGIAAQELGIRWAKRFDATLVGLAIVDDPGIQVSEDALFGDAQERAASEAMRAEIPANIEASLELAIQQFATRCGDAGVDFRTIEEVGSPHLHVLLEAQRHDLILLGQNSRFEFGFEGGPGQTLIKVLRDSPRPVVAVPEAIGDGESIVVAYDGSLQAARALLAFVATGLARGRKVHIISADAEREDAARHLDRALDFLSAHEIEAIPHPCHDSDKPAESILAMLPRLDAGLVVMGAYGQPVLREFFVGSVTRTMLEQSPVPLFLFH